jgi:hypothetical protein
VITLLKHNQINQSGWDDCIRESLNSMPYACSWWLNIVSPGWEALILDDYEAVMPLTCQRKGGFSYLYQPFFTQQLGVFSKNGDHTDSFLGAIPADFRYIDIQLNTGNNPTLPGFDIFPRTNFVLDLRSEYINLLSGYHRNCRRNIQKARHAGYTVKSGPGATIFSRFVQNNLENQLTVRSKNIFPLLPDLIMASQEHSASEILGAYSNQGELQAAGWFIYTPTRCLFMVCASTAQGKANQSMYLLVDHVIQQKAGTGLLFDFTGSNMPGVAYFNSGFGAVKTPYPAIRKNRLPWPVSWFKR